MKFVNSEMYTLCSVAARTFFYLATLTTNCDSKIRTVSCKYCMTATLRQSLIVKCSVYFPANSFCSLSEVCEKYYVQCCCMYIFFTVSLQHWQPSVIEDRDFVNALWQLSSLRCALYLVNTLWQRHYNTDSEVQCLFFIPWQFLFSVLLCTVVFFLTKMK